MNLSGSWLCSSRFLEQLRVGPALATRLGPLRKWRNRPAQSPSTRVNNVRKRPTGLGLQGEDLQALAGVLAFQLTAEQFNFSPMFLFLAPVYAPESASPTPGVRGLHRDTLGSPWHTGQHWWGRITGWLQSAWEQGFLVQVTKPARQVQRRQAS